MRTKIALCVAATGMMASPALAQEQSQDIAPSGFYVGAVAGYEGLDAESANGGLTATADSAVYGIVASYDLSLGSAFVGIEGELSTSGGSTAFPNNFAGARDGLEANGQYYVGVRAGFAITPGIAAYGKVGYTALDATAFTTAGNLGELDENASGVRFGGGLQVQLPGPLEGRIEYRRSSYENLGVDVSEASTDQVTLGLGVRF